MKIIPLASESMGTRSMATYVETRSCRILIDPGAAIAQFRYGLEPHDMEKWCLKKHKERILMFSHSTEIIIITHYHYDHFIHDDPELYRNKWLLLKNPNQKINISQRHRAFEFIRSIKSVAGDISFIDGRSISEGDTVLKFSSPSPHGIEEKGSFVVQTFCGEDDDGFLFTSDLQGLWHKDAIDFISSCSPDTLYLDGPITYIQGDGSLSELLERTNDELCSIIGKSWIKRIIIDHHLLRDIKWEEKIRPVFSLAKKRGVSITTAAEFRGETNNLLEARRDQLYKKM